MTHSKPGDWCRQNAKDTIEAIKRIKSDSVLKERYTAKGGNKRNILLAAFQRWSRELIPAKNILPIVEKVTKIETDNDILYSACLKTEDKCSAYRYIAFRFQVYTYTKY